MGNIKLLQAELYPTYNWWGPTARWMKICEAWMSNPPPPESNMSPKRNFNKRSSASNHYFSGDMLVFGGGSIVRHVPEKIPAIQVPSITITPKNSPLSRK